MLGEINLTNRAFVEILKTNLRTIGGRYPFEIFTQNFFSNIETLIILICVFAPKNVLHLEISQCDSMRDVIFPLPGLAGGGDSGGTVIFK